MNGMMSENGDKRVQDIKDTMTEFSDVINVSVVFDSFMTDYLTQLLSKIDENVSSVNLFIDLLLDLTEKEVIGKLNMIVKLEIIFDSLSVNQNVSLFENLENDRLISVLSSSDESTKSKIVTVFNVLLKRISKEYSVFRGRILILVSHLIPMYDKSGSNFGGTFNLDHLIVINKDLDKMDVEEKIISTSFYNSLWELVNILKNPLPIIEDNDSWAHMEELLDVVLNEFENSKLNSQPTHMLTQNYFPNFLTTPEVLKLEMKDPYFVKNILIQIVIFLQALKRSSVTSKKKRKDNSEYVLSERKLAQVNELTERTFTICRNLCSEKFEKKVKNIIEREENWIEWKRKSCPPILPSDPKKRKSTSDLKKWQRPTKLTLGSSHMDNIWENPITYENFEGVPTEESFFSVAIEEMRFEPDLDQSLRLSSNDLFQWRGCRLMMNTNIEDLRKIKSKKDFNKLLTANANLPQDAKMDTDE